MKSLFRSFEKEGVRYLLIGGQAAILYGASHFTQDLDLWVDPAGPVGHGPQAARRPEIGAGTLVPANR